MEAKEIKRMRYRYWTLGLKFNKVGTGYRLYDLNGNSIQELEGIDCSKLFSIEEIADLLEELLKKAE